jgi:membrane associated rhomboid family serine protease
VTLALTFVFVFVFRVEQNVAYVLGLSSRELVTLDVFPVGAVVQAAAPFVHATPGHLVSTLVWFVPFGYLLERRREWPAYVGFVLVAGVVSTTFAPAVFVVLGVADGLALGASGVTFALVGREASVRLRGLRAWRSLSRRQWALLAAVVAALGLKLLALAGDPAGDTSTVGHISGLLVGVLAGVAGDDGVPGEDSS